MHNAKLLSRKVLPIHFPKSSAGERPFHCIHAKIKYSHLFSSLPIDNNEKTQLGILTCSYSIALESE